MKGEAAVRGIVTGQGRGGETPAAGATPHPWRRRALLGGGLFALATALGLLDFGSKVTEVMSYGERGRLAPPLLDELSAAYGFVLLLYPVVLFMRRFPIGRANWATRVPLHLLVSLLFGGAHTLVMWGSRSALYPLLGWGPYDYGDMRFRFPMEYQQQILSYAIVYAVVAVVGYVRANQARALEAKELERQLSEARLSALKSQLNPHFLFNSLNMISALVHEDPARADTMIARLSDFLRLTLDHSGDQEVALHRELQSLDGYLAIMACRFGDRLEVEVSAAPDTRQRLIPHLLLQPLVENAVQHSTADPGRPGRVRVTAERHGSALLLAVEDNGPGLPSSGAVSEGVGLSNTRLRLQALYGPDQDLLLAQSPLGGLRVALRVPGRPAPSPEAGP